MKQKTNIFCFIYVLGDDNGDVFFIKVNFIEIMKPTKNRVFCVDCGRAKQLFDSQEKAIRFIEFNSENILEESGRVPVRCYFCSACGGWHITSNPHQLNVKSKSEIAIERLREINANKRSYKDKTKEGKARIKRVVEELAEKYKQTEVAYLKAANREERKAIIENFLNETREIRMTMALTKAQSKKIHILEEQVRSMKY